MTWRDKATSVITNIMHEHPNTHGKDLQKLLYNAYPFGMRKYHPYRVWLTCVNEACGKKHKTKPLNELPMFCYPVDVEDAVNPEQRPETSHA